MQSLGSVAAAEAAGEARRRRNRPPRARLRRIPDGEQEKQASCKPQAATIEVSEFDSLLKKEFKPKSDRAKEAVEARSRRWPSSACSTRPIVSDDAVQSIESIIAEIDKKLTEQVNQIMHHEDFQQLEGLLARSAPSRQQHRDRRDAQDPRDEHLEEGPGQDLKKFKGTAWDQSPIFKKLYEEEYGQFGGEPYGCLVGDYHFDHSPPDVELLGEMAQVAARRHARSSPAPRRPDADGHPGRS